MTKWTEGGVALPSRSDVPTPAGKDVLAAGSAYARPGSGFMPGWPDGPEGVPGRLHGRDPEQHLQRRRRGRRDQDGDRHGTRRVSDQSVARQSGPVACAGPGTVIERHGGGDPWPALTRRAAAPARRGARRRPPATCSSRSRWLLFLVLNIGSIFYAAVHQRLGVEHPDAVRSASWASTTTPRRWPTRCSRRRSGTASTTRSCGSH